MCDWWRLRIRVEPRSDGNMHARGRRSLLSLVCERAHWRALRLLWCRMHRSCLSGELGWGAYARMHPYAGGVCSADASWWADAGSSCIGRSLHTCIRWFLDFSPYRGSAATARRLLQVSPCVPSLLLFFSKENINAYKKTYAEEKAPSDWIETRFRSVCRPYATRMQRMQPMQGRSMRCSASSRHQAAKAQNEVKCAEQ